MIELVYCSGHLQAGLQQGLLALDADVLRPAHIARKVLHLVDSDSNVGRLAGRLDYFGVGGLG